MATKANVFYPTIPGFGQGDPVTRPDQERSILPVSERASQFGLGVLKGLGDLAIGIPTMAARATQVFAPFADVKTAGLNVANQLGLEPGESGFRKFLADLPDKPSYLHPLSFGSSVLQIFGLQKAQSQIAAELERQGKPTELSLPLAISEVTGVTSIVRGLTTKDPLTGEQLSPEETGRELVTGLVPAKIIASMVGGGIKGAFSERPVTDLVDRPAARVVTRADIAKMQKAETARRVAEVEAQLRYERASSILHSDEPAGDIPLGRQPSPDDLVRAISNDPRTEVPPDIVEQVLKTRPEMTEILEPQALKRAIFGAREDVLGALRELPKDKRSLQINQQISELLRSGPGLTEATIVEIAEKGGFTREAVVDRLMANQLKMADDIEKGAFKTGGFLHELSDPAKALKALQELSPNQVDRIAAFNRRLKERASAMDAINDIFVRPQLASMVSGWGNAMRDMMTQQGFNLLQAFEHTVEGAGVLGAETIENATRRLRGLQTRPREPDLVHWKEGTLELHKTLTYGANVAERMAKQLDPRNLKYQSQALVADLRGKPHPPVPEILRDAEETSWTNIIDSVPTLSQRMMGDQIADINAHTLKLEQFKVLKQKISQVALPEGRARALVDATRTAADIYSNLVTAPRRIADLEQTKQFFQIRMAAHALRNGLDVSNPVKLAAELERLAKLPAEERPVWVDDALNDSFNYAMRTTFRAPAKSTMAKFYINLHRKLPILNFFGLRFPVFMINKMGLMWDRQPFQVSALLRPEFIRSLAGSLDDAKLTDQIVQVTPEAKKIWNRGLDTTEDASLRSKLFADARKIARERPDYQKLRNRAIHKIQERTMKDFSRGLSGIVLFMTALQIRNSPFAGPKYNEIDLGPSDPNNPAGKRRIADARNFNPLAEYLALATVVDAVQRGENIFNTIGGDDMLEIIAGIRRIEETGLGVTDVVRALQQGHANPDRALSAAQQIAASNIGAYTAFFRNFRDVAELADSDSEEIAQDIRNPNPWSGPLLANLPNAWQSRLRELESAGKQTGPLPPAINPFENKPLYTASPGMRLLGIQSRIVTPLQRLMNKTGLSQGDLVGNSGSRKFDQIVAKRLGWILDQPTDKEGHTLGDFLVQSVLTANRAKVAAGMNPVLSMRETLGDALDAIREVASNFAMIDAAGYDMNILRDIELNKLSPAEREWIQRLLKITPGAPGKPLVGVAAPAGGNK